MALTDIARQLKETFDGFAVSEHQEELEKFRRLYGDAECIRIGEMDYIVINDVYDSESFYKERRIPDNTSPLFFNSINNQYAIIDAKTSSTLIDEVYSRVTYMQRVCESDIVAPDSEVIGSMKDLLGDSENIVRIVRDEQTDREKSLNKANIFQCQLIKDTGVSAAPDAYSFMLKNNEIKEISDNVMRQIKRTGEVRLLKNREVLEENKTAIQQAVFDKYDKADIDIQSVTVKSIFEIRMSFQNIHLMIGDGSDRTGVFNTSYLASKQNEFAALNASIHVCNCCGHDLVDVDTGKIEKLHINTDALDPGFTSDRNAEEKRVYSMGCEDCLEQCPDCGNWHFNYEKFIGSRMYDRVKLAPRRSFIRGLRAIEGNYCFCREGVEWVYDERSGTETEHDIIPIEKLVFINYANEVVADYGRYRAFYERELKKHKRGDAAAESKFAQRCIERFRKILADEREIDVKDVSITSVEKCLHCSVCGGGYYRGVQGGDYNYRCNVCDEMVTEKKRMVTRVDGIVFMRRTARNKNIINKYVVTKLGNLKKISSHIEGTDDEQSESQA